MAKPEHSVTDDKAKAELKTVEYVRNIYGCVGMVGGGCATLLMIGIVAAIHFLAKYW